MGNDIGGWYYHRNSKEQRAKAIKAQRAGLLARKAVDLALTMERELSQGEAQRLAYAVLKWGKAEGVVWNEAKYVPTTLRIMLFNKLREKFYPVE